MKRFTFALALGAVLCFASFGQAQHRGGFAGASFGRTSVGVGFNRGFATTLPANQFRFNNFNRTFFPPVRFFPPAFVGASYLPSYSYGANYSYPASYGANYSLGGSSGLFTTDAAGNVYDAQTGQFMGRLIR